MPSQTAEKEKGESSDAPEKPGKGEKPAEKGSNLTVAVRVRPLNGKEEGRQSWATVEVLDDHVIVNDPDDKMGGIDYLRLDKTKTKHYRFDHAFGPLSTQQEVYEQTTKPLASKAIEGYNACCFAYGASKPPPPPRRCAPRAATARRAAPNPALTHPHLSPWQPALARRTR